MANFTVIKGREQEDNRKEFHFTTGTGKKGMTKANDKDKALEIIKVSLPDEAIYMEAV